MSSDENELFSSVPVSTSESLQAPPVDAQSDEIVTDFAVINNVVKTQTNVPSTLESDIALPVVGMSIAEFRSGGPPASTNSPAPTFWRPKGRAAQPAVKTTAAPATPKPGSNTTTRPQ